MLSKLAGLVLGSRRSGITGLFDHRRRGGMVGAVNTHRRASALGAIAVVAAPFVIKKLMARRGSGTSA